MNPMTFAIIAVKLISIYLVINGIMQVPNMVNYLQLSSAPNNGINAVNSVYIVSIFAPIIAGVILWLISNRFSEYIVENLPETEPSAISSAHIQSVAISTAGLMVAVLSIPDVVNYGVQLFGHLQIVNGEKVFSTSLLSYFLAVCVKTALGCSLIISAPRWAKLIHKFSIKA